MKTMHIILRFMFFFNLPGRVYVIFKETRSLPFAQSRLLPGFS